MTDREHTKARRLADNPRHWPDKVLERLLNSVVVQDDLFRLFRSGFEYEEALELEAIIRREEV